MSRKGQNTFIGISDQADVALLYLLRASKRSAFQRIIIEGEDWEDFTLVFDDHSEDYEIKSRKKQITYSDVKKIVDKELRKRYGEKDLLKIVVRRLSDEFRNGYEYVHNYMYLIELEGGGKDLTIQKFLSKGWTKDEMSFLPKVEIIEFGKIENIHNQISEYFALEHHFYLSPEDQESIVARSFRRIMQMGKQGGTITRRKFLGTVDIFEKNIVEKSESFSPDKALGEKVGKIKQFLSSEKNLRDLFVTKYLSPISSNRRLIFYLVDKLEQSQFHVDSFRAFIDKILLKQDYIGLTLRILEKKKAQDKIDNAYLLDFLIKNYKKLLYDFNYDDALNMIKEIVGKDTQGLFEEKVLDFLGGEVLTRFKEKVEKRQEKRKRGWSGDEVVAEIFEIYYQRTKDKRAFIDFIFEYFDFASDDSKNVIETHSKIYSLVKDFIALRIPANLRYIVRKISGQFNSLYNGKYKGYEWIGSGISQVGSNYSITDRGIVRLLFQPLFLEMYKANPQKAWQFFRQEILEKAKKKASKNNPVYLKRALASILIDRIEDDILSEIEKEESFEYLENVLRMKGGIPDTSEIIFDNLRSSDSEKIGYENIMKLIEVDSIKYKRVDNPAGYPTNLFVMDTLFTLIKANYPQAKRFFIDLINKPGFVERDRWYDSFELLIAKAIPERDPDFIVEIFSKFDFERYLNSFDRDFVWDKSGLITGLITRDWQDGTNRGEKIINALLKDKVPSQKVLEFLAGPIRNLAQKDASKTYRLFKRYLKDKRIFRNTFKNNDYARQSIVWLGEELAKSKRYREAMTIVELCVDDPDPRTHNREEDFNYHLQVKQEQEQIAITTVRGAVAWVLQKFALSNNPEFMEYALKGTEMLLDLEGNLANKLGYTEPDLYVRLQALVPLVEFAHPWRRKKLNEYKRGLGDSVKKLAFNVLDATDSQFKSKEAKPKALLKHLVSVFSYIRDLTTNEAKKILKFFEDYEETESHFLFIYFAEFNQDKPFDSIFFKEKLKEMCVKKNIFRESFSRQFWSIAEDDNKKKTDNFEKIEHYWKLLFEEYQKEVFDDLYRTLGITLTWRNKYSAHKELLKTAFDKEINYYKSMGEPVQLWKPGKEIFQILKHHSDEDFLEVFYGLIKNLKENIHYFWIKDWITLFKSIKPKIKHQKALCSKIRAVLRNLYPEYLES